MGFRSGWEMSSGVLLRSVPPLSPPEKKGQRQVNPLSSGVYTKAERSYTEPLRQSARAVTDPEQSAPLPQRLFASLYPDDPQTSLAAERQAGAHLDWHSAQIFRRLRRQAFQPGKDRDENLSRLAPFRRATTYADADSPVIRHQAAELLRSEGQNVLSQAGIDPRGLSDDELLMVIQDAANTPAVSVELLRLMGRFAQNHVKYERLGNRRLKASDYCLQPSGNCYGSALLLIALLRAVGVPCGFCVELTEGAYLYGYACSNILLSWLHGQVTKHAYVAALILQEDGSILRLEFDPADDEELVRSLAHVNYPYTRLTEVSLTHPRLGRMDFGPRSLLEIGPVADETAIIDMGTDGSKVAGRGMLQSYVQSLQKFDLQGREPGDTLPLRPLNEIAAKAFVDFARNQRDRAWEMISGDTLAEELAQLAQEIAAEGEGVNEEILVSFIDFLSRRELGGSSILNSLLRGEPADEEDLGASWDSLLADFTRVARAMALSNDELELLSRPDVQADLEAIYQRIRAKETLALRYGGYRLCANIRRVVGSPQDEPESFIEQFRNWQIYQSTCGAPGVPAPLYKRAYLNFLRDERMGVLSPKQAVKSFCQSEHASQLESINEELCAELEDFHAMMSVRNDCLLFIGQQKETDIAAEAFLSSSLAERHLTPGYALDGHLGDAVTLLQEIFQHAASKWQLEVMNFGAGWIRRQAVNYGTPWELHDGFLKEFMREHPALFAVYLREAHRESPTVAAATLYLQQTALDHYVCWPKVVMQEFAESLHTAHESFTSIPQIEAAYERWIEAQPGRRTFLHFPQLPCYRQAFVESWAPFLER